MAKPIAGILVFAGKETVMQPAVYEPREDSWLLEKAIAAYAFGRVLDLGTGSGIQAIAAARKKEVGSVVATDINPNALKQAKANAATSGVAEKIVFIKSDLFENIQGKFDTIAFNPPYLPEDEEKVGDVALESGESGRKLTEKFLNEFERHLNPKGVVLLLQSSASGWKETKQALEEKSFAVETVGRDKFFFEEIVVLKAQRK
ncbi:MAG: methyltransferase [Candidatus Norongarragalinales archaeon]